MFVAVDGSPTGIIAIGEVSATLSTELSHDSEVGYCVKDDVIDPSPIFGAFGSWYSTRSLSQPFFRAAARAFYARYGIEEQIANRLSPASGMINHRLFRPLRGLSPISQRPGATPAALATGYFIVAPLRDSGANFLCVDWSEGRRRISSSLSRTDNGLC
jgi:hypothetical protein